MDDHNIYMGRSQTGTGLLGTLYFHKQASSKKYRVYSTYFNKLYISFKV